MYVDVCENETEFNEYIQKDIYIYIMMFMQSVMCVCIYVYVCTYVYVCVKMCNYVSMYACVCALMRTHSITIYNVTHTPINVCKWTLFVVFCILVHF